MKFYKLFSIVFSLIVITQVSPLFSQKGKTVIITFNNENQFFGELLSARETALVVFKGDVPKKVELSDNTSDIIVVHNFEISKVTIKGKFNLFKGFVSLTLFGVTTGAIIGLTNMDDRGGMALFWSYFLGNLGALLGLISGGLTSEGDKTIYVGPNTPLSFLKQYARFQGEEPDFLRLLK